MPRIPIRLLLAAIVGAVVLWAMGTWASRAAMGLGGAIDDPPLSPEPYRAEMQHVDALVFAPASNDAEMTRDLAASIDALAQRVDREGRTKLARYFAGELRVLADRTRRGADVGERRRQWQRIRSSLFADASWFRMGEDDVTATAPPAPRTLSTAEQARLAALESVLARLDQLVERGRRDVAGLAEPEDDALWAQQHPAEVEAWARWEAGWLADVRAFGAEVARDTSRIERVEVRYAQQSTERAIDRLRTVPTHWGARPAPFRRESDEAFADASKQLGKARHWIEEARRD